MKNAKKPSKGWSTQSLLPIHTLRIYLASILVKEVLHSCGIREREIPSMTKEMTAHGLSLMSSRRSLINKNTI